MPCALRSLQRYRFTADDLILPFGIDKPFGALDGEGFCTGLRNVSSEEVKEKNYFKYVESSLHNPQIVGTHWFKYGDFPLTVWPNAHCGLVDICDNPYPGLVNSMRKIGYQMYQIRYNSALQ